MNHMQPAARVIIAGASTLASLALLAQVAFPFPLATIAMEELASNAAGLQRYYVIDTIYTIAWLIAWAGIAAIVGAKSRWLMIAASVLTFIGMMFGLVKNEWTNALATAYSNGVDISSWWLLFKAVGGMSFLCVCTGIALASATFFDGGRVSKLAGALGVITIFAAALGVYIPSLFLFTLLLGLLWTLTVTVMLWMWAKNPQQA